MIKKAIKGLDYAISRLVAPFVPERTSLITFLFHGLFLDDREIGINHVDPQQKITVEHFRQFLRYYREREYVFVSPDDVVKGLPVGGKYILITFDDGYFNNSYVVPVLEEFKVPAVFFVSPNYIVQQKSFWWDVLYRERFRQGVTERQIAQEQADQKVKTAAQIEKYLIEQFGASSLKPLGDIDRPFTAEEFRQFASSPYVYIGNHTADHAILTNYTPQGVREQILNAQFEIYRLTGKKPNIISYPNGSWNPMVIRVTRELGFILGITIEPKKNYLPFNVNEVDAAKLGRFILVGDAAISMQCELFKSEYSLYNSIKNFLRRSRHH